MSAKLRPASFSRYLDRNVDASTFVMRVETSMTRQTLDNVSINESNSSCNNLQPEVGIKKCMINKIKPASQQQVFYHLLL